MKNKTVTAEISVTIPILKTLEDDGLVLNVGALTLKCGDRNFILDSTETNWTSGKRKGKKFELSTTLVVDLDTFEEGEEYNYDLTEEDLKSKDLVAEFYCSDDDVEEENSFDFDKAKFALIVTVDDKCYEIKNVTFE